VGEEWNREAEDNEIYIHSGTENLLPSSLGQATPVSAHNVQSLQLPPLHLMTCIHTHIALNNAYTTAQLP